MELVRVEIIIEVPDENNRLDANSPEALLTLLEEALENGEITPSQVCQILADLGHEIRRPRRWVR